MSDERWTADTENLVAARAHRAECMSGRGRDCPSFANPSQHDRQTARDILTALDGAGLLVVVVTPAQEGQDETYFDEQTLFKVDAALQRAGLTDQQAKAAINEMLNAGILFRERAPAQEETAE